MITYLPEIYPDELVYSWFCRYYVHSGCLTHRMALEDILHNRSCHPSKEFLGHLNPEMEKKIQEIYSLDHLIKSHTLYPQYARFVPLTIKEKALQALAYESCDPHHVLPILPRGEEDQFLKYCPVCVREDRGWYGETYWHRSHQLRQVQVCHKHHCKLENSTVTAKSEKTYTLCPAEEYAVRGEARINHDSLSQEFAEYVTNVFHAPMDVERDIPIRVVLYEAMKGTPYRSMKGNMHFTKRLAEDMRAFYGESAATFCQLQRTLLGERFDFSVVCQISYFLGLSVEELTAPTVSKVERQEEQNSHYMKEKIPIDWRGYDEELAPKLEAIARAIYTGEASKIGRPERVSERRIYRELGLAAHSLEHLPKCRLILEKHTESYEENWARRIVWAYCKLKAERKDKPFYWSDIRVLSGVKKHNVEKTIPLIQKYADNKTIPGIIRLLE